MCNLPINAFLNDKNIKFSPRKGKKCDKDKKIQNLVLESVKSATNIFDH